MPSSSLYLLHRKGRRSTAEHAIRLTSMTLIFLALSAVAIFYSLGYQYNAAAHTVQRTGSVYLNMFSNQHGEVYRDGVDEGSVFPYRAGHLFPGTYTLKIAEPGFQDWQRTVYVGANQVVSYSNILLLRTNLPNVAAQSSWLPATTPTTNSKIEIRNGSEIWLDKKFVTRVSQDISQAVQYVDGQHIVYQSGKEIWILDPDSLTSQLITTLSTTDKTPLAFRQNGRLMVYRDQGEVKALELY